MKINQLIVVQETREKEGRVALTPKAVAELHRKSVQVWVESDAGKLSNFSDQDYTLAGARIFKIRDQKLPSQSLILRVKCPVPARREVENQQISTGSTMMGFLDPLESDRSHIQEWAALGIQLIPLELMKFSPTDPRNALAAMSRFAGRLALQDALRRYTGKDPIRVTILGTGPAGLSAAHFAQEQGLPVQVFGRRNEYRADLEKAGIRYHLLPEKEQNAFILNTVTDQNIVITAARVPGQKAPILVDSKVISHLPDHTVLIDLSAGEGGNVVNSRQDAVVPFERGISVVNLSGYPKAEPQAASEAYAACMVALVHDLLFAPKNIEKELKSAQVTSSG